MTSRLRPAWIMALIALAGCGPSGTIRFAHDPTLNSEDFAAKPRLRAKVIEETNRLFGESPQHLRVPAGAGLQEGGRYLGNLTQETVDGEEDGALSLVVYMDHQGREVPIAGGQALYRRHCMHCHGVTGDGDGPTAPFLYPRPRDYRRGMFKFTMTNSGKPTRDDLRRTVLQGLHGTSMPAFEALMTRQEIEQVIDYVIFLSMRGEFQYQLADIATGLDESEENIAYLEEESEPLASQIFDFWRRAQAPESIANPHGPRVAATQDSIHRGRELFLGTSKDVKLVCAGCHGARGRGDGPSWVDKEAFDRFVFGGDPSPERIRALGEYAGTEKGWSDDWGDPLRPADLNKGVYKGGRRPIDIYWRIATGISGTPMPGHTSALSENPDDIWHLVNFVLALPYDRELLQGVDASSVEAAPVANQPTATETEPEISDHSMTALP
ncbi:hypothetical protein BH23PLA1_BH23PLA1_13560 [soil metagenome]